MSRSAKPQGQKAIRLNLKEPGTGMRRDVTANQETNGSLSERQGQLSARDSCSQTMMVSLGDTGKGDKTGGE